MSGGSYDYLKDYLDRVGFPGGHLVDMVHRAGELAPGSPGAVALRKLLADAEDLDRQWGSLYDVMHDIEWADSGDQDEADAVKTLLEWKAAAP